MLHYHSMSIEIAILMNVKNTAFSGCSHVAFESDGLSSEFSVSYSLIGDYLLYKMQWWD